MTTLREAAQQALKALEQCGLDDTHRSYEFEHAARAALRAALAQQAEPRNQCGETCERAKLCATCAQALAQQDEPETCTWHQDGDSDSGVYATSCRHYFNLEDGTPEDNKMQWCCYCGKKLVQELITEGGDE